MSYSLDNKFNFIDSFQFLSSSVDSLVSNLDFKHLSQEYDSRVLDLVKQKGFFHYEYMCDFKKFNEILPSNSKLFIVHSSLVI